MLAAALAARGVSPDDVHTVLATHLHSDHVSALPQLGDVELHVHAAELGRPHAHAGRGLARPGDRPPLLPGGRARSCRGCAGSTRPATPTATSPSWSRRTTAWWRSPGTRRAPTPPGSRRARCPRTTRAGRSTSPRSGRSATPARRLMIPGHNPPAARGARLTGRGGGAGRRRRRSFVPGTEETSTCDPSPASRGCSAPRPRTSSSSSRLFFPWYGVASFDFNGEDVIPSWWLMLVFAARRGADPRRRRLQLRAARGRRTRPAAAAYLTSVTFIVTLMVFLDGDARQPQVRGVARADLLARGDHSREWCTPARRRVRLPPSRPGKGSGPVAIVDDVRDYAKRAGDAVKQRCGGGPAQGAGHSA